MIDPYEKINRACSTLGKMLYWTDELRRGHVDPCELGRRLEPLVQEMHDALFPARAEGKG